MCFARAQKQRSPRECPLLSCAAAGLVQYTVRVSNVSLKASERDIYDFFAFSGEISSIQTKPCG